MKWLRSNWQYIGGILFVALAFFIGIRGHLLDPRQRLMILLYMTMLAHQFEEYAWPGGFPLAWNAGTSGEKVLYDRYPMNKKGSTFSNLAFWVVYIAFIFLYKHPIFIIVASYMAFGQVMMHGVVMNKKSHTKYSPGMATAIFLMAPMSIYTIWYLATHYDIPAWNWWGAALLLPVFLVTLLGIPLKVTTDKNSPDRYTAEELSRGGVPARLGIRIREEER